MKNLERREHLKANRHRVGDAQCAAGEARGERLANQPFHGEKESALFFADVV